MQQTGWEITISFMEGLEETRRILATDIKAAYNGDPAAVYTEEILLGYPSVQAVTIYRLAHELFVLGVPIVPRIMTEYAHEKRGLTSIRAQKSESISLSTTARAWSLGKRA